MDPRVSGRFRVYPKNKIRFFFDYRPFFFRTHANINRSQSSKQKSFKLEDEVEPQLHFSSSPESPRVLLTTSASSRAKSQMASCDYPPGWHRVIILQVRRMTKMSTLQIQNLQPLVKESEKDSMMIMVMLNQIRNRGARSWKISQGWKITMIDALL